MGIVWEAENLLTGRRVALKQVLRSDEQHRRRLLKEARACGRLAHRNIIEVLDVGETESGDPFLVMPLLTGETVAEFLARKRRLAPWLAAKISRDIARALTIAHAAGIIHRDLKPANTFLHSEPGTEGVVVKVLDFGVCKELDPKATVLTVDGRPIGTPAYMSPEQFTRRVDLDHRTDIWSLGVVLFEMLTGVRPFRGERVEEVIAKIIAGPIPTVAQLVRSVPPGLVSIVSRCLTRDREERIGSAQELAAMLDMYTSADAACAHADQAGLTTSGIGDPTGTASLSPPTEASASILFAPSSAVGAGPTALAMTPPNSPLSSGLAPTDSSDLEPSILSTFASASPRKGLLLFCGGIVGIGALSFSLHALLGDRTQPSRPAVATSRLRDIAPRFAPPAPPPAPTVQPANPTGLTEKPAPKTSSTAPKNEPRASSPPAPTPQTSSPPISKRGAKAPAGVNGSIKGISPQDGCKGILIKRCPTF